MTMRLRTMTLAAAFAALATSALPQTVLETYRAEIGAVDRQNSSGAPLRGPIAMMVQDRANVHRFGRSQPGDTVDSVFASRGMRAQMPSLLARGGLSPAAEAALRSGAPALLEVRIYGSNGVPSSVTADLVGAASTGFAPSDPQLSPAELSREARTIQSALNARGFDAGPVDGQPGQRTRSAIAAYQSSIGKAPTGVLTRSELAALTSGFGALGAGGFDRGNPAYGNLAPGNAGPSFDCARAATPTEIAICTNPSLAALDRALADAWNARGRPADQAAWLQTRNACGANAACLAQSMQARVQNLGGSLALGPGAAPIPTPGLPFADGSDGFVPGAESTPVAQIPAGPRAHIDQGKIVDAPDGFARRLAMLAIQSDPSVLDDPSTIDAFRRLANAETDPADRQFNALNVIEKEDARAALRAALIEEANSVRPVTPEDPLDVTLYAFARPGTYADGLGLELVGGAPQVVVTARPYPVGQITLTLPTEIFGPLPVERAEAAAFIDRVTEAGSQGRQLRHVIWGQITRIGRDESVESFAQQAVYRGVPATFQPARAELHLVAMNNQRRAILPLEPGTAPLHRWDLGQDGSEVVAGQSALVLARSLGLPVVDDMLDVPLPAANANRTEWSTFTALSWLGQNPDAPREGNAFIGVAQGLMSDADYRSFFGRTRGSNPYIVQMVTNGQNVSDPFPDEFARRDASRVFFDRYYDAILARAPTWPVQVRHSTVLSLGQYDFDTESFPIQRAQSGLPDGQFRVVNLPADGRYEGLASAARFGNLPEALQVPPDEARVLRQLAQDRQVRLVWWADFDYSVDTSATEQAFGTRRNSTIRTGQGTLRRIGIYAGPNLDWEVVSLPVDAVMIPAPQAPETLVAPTVSDLARQVAEAETSDQMAIAGHVAKLMGEDGFEAVARLMPEVVQANEFDAPAAVNTAIASLRAGAERPLVIRTGLQLDTYDLEKGTFAFREGGMNVRVRQGNLQATISLVGPDAFAPLSMDRETARFVAENRRRNIMVLAALTPETAERLNGRANQFTLFARPDRMVFYTLDDNNLPQVIAERGFDAANATAEERMSRRFVPAEFEGLDQTPLRITPHIVDLVALKGGHEPSNPELEAMVAAAWDARDAGHAGPALFEEAQTQPDSVWVTRHRAMIRSWLQAKAAALGSDFTARISARPDRTCGTLLEAYGHLGQEIMAALPRLSEDQNALARAVQSAEGPVAVPRRYAIANTRSHPAQADRCTSAMAVLVFEDAVHEGRSARDAVATHVAFTLTDVKSVDGPGNLPGFILRGTATATRIEDEDGGLGAVLTPTPDAAQDPAPTDQASPLGDSAPQVTEQDRLAAAQAVISGAREVPPEEPVDWPEVTLEGLGKAERDLLGLAPGQKMADAVAAIEAQDGIEAVFETAAALPEEATPAQRALGYQRVYLRRGGTEALTIASWSPDGEVVGIMRRMVLPDGMLPFDRIVAALDEKYDAPDMVYDEVGFRGWGTAQENCFAMPFSMQALPRLVPADEGETPFLQMEGSAHHLGMPDFSEEFAGLFADCGEVLSYIEERHNPRGPSGFSVVLMDFDRLHAARTSLTPEGAAPDDFEIEF